MTDPTATPRRFRFGLRSLFVLVTVASMATAWVTYSLNWIRQRQEAIDFRTALPLAMLGFREEPKAPAGLWLFGETGEGVLWAEKEDVERVRQLFPEATVIDQPRK